ncbi:MAG TPA: hypothetical protein VGM83_10270 [Devosiaceae bacterium]
MANPPTSKPTTRKTPVRKAAAASEPGVERVDFLVDSDGSVIDTPEADAPEIEEEIEQVVESTSPSGWFGWGIFALGVLIAVLGVLQVIGRSMHG